MFADRSLAELSSEWLYQAVDRYRSRGRGHLMKELGKDQRPRSRWDLHRKTNRVNKPGPLRDLRIEAINQRIYRGWNVLPVSLCSAHM